MVRRLAIHKQYLRLKNDCGVVIMATSDLKEPAFGQNKFRKPLVLEGPEVVVQSVLMVLFGKPGCYPSIPELGMRIQRYRVWQIDETELEEIQNTLSYQCGLIREGFITESVEASIGYIEDDKPVLLLQIPVTNEHNRFNIIVGIMDDGKETVYNYQLVNSMLMQ